MQHAMLLYLSLWERKRGMFFCGVWCLLVIPAWERQVPSSFP